MNAIYSINVDGRDSTMIKLLDIINRVERKPTILLIQDPPILSREIKIKTYI